jgi:uncharacterized protein (TIGR02300 family)
MSKNEARGTKRSCQNPECGSRFYDLNRDPIACPLCGAAYVIASAPHALPTAPRIVRKISPAEIADGDAIAANEEAPTQDSEELLTGTETAEPVVVEADETVLEEEEDGDDVSGILDGPVERDEKDT